MRSTTFTLHKISLWTRCWRCNPILRLFQGTPKFLRCLRRTSTCNNLHLSKLAADGHSKRAFQKRFKEWGFPSKHVPAPSDAALFDRIRALWETNTTHKQMIIILNDEGFNVNERQLSKIRHKNQLWIRENRGSSNVAPVENETTGEYTVGDGYSAGQKRARGGEEQLPPEVVARRRETHARMLAESEERLRSKTRRRRTRGWAGLPPDEGTDPRFPSELTLAEAIVDLNLDKDQYKEVRHEFEQICQAQNLIKKTTCGPERWADAKQQLIAKFANLQEIFWGPDSVYLNQTRKPMALDVICMDVTKRLRTAGKHITIADAKNTLGLTPQEAREARAAFDAILRADFFTGKLESTKERWEELKSRWINGSTRLRVTLSLGQADPAYEGKVRAIEAIARDVQKRNRDSQTRYLFPRDGSTVTRPEPAKDMRPVAFDFPKRSGTGNGRRRASKTTVQSPSQPGHGPNFDQSRRAGQELLKQVNGSFNVDVDAPVSNPIATLASQALANAPVHVPDRGFAGMQIDPSLLEAAALPHQHHDDSEVDILAQIQQASLTEPTTKSVYFRLAPASIQHFPHANKIWLDTLPAGARDVEHLRTLALRKSGVEGVARVSRVEGWATGEGGERWPIEEDDELEAYLSMVGTRKATFTVELAELRS